jgi:hypothetical protein
MTNFFIDRISSTCLPVGKVPVRYSLLAIRYPLLDILFK